MTPVNMHILKFAAHHYYPISVIELNAISIMLQAQLGPTLIRNTMPRRPVSDLTPLMHIRLPPLSPPHSLATDTQKSLPSFTKPYNVASSKTPDITSVFLDQMKDLKSQIQQTQNFLLKSIMSQAWPPLTSPERNLISSTNVLNEACPKSPSMFHFLFMNIAHLIGKTKQKL